jgi:RNA polymerase sigma-70 factor (ECF subfamily)
MADPERDDSVATPRDRLAALYDACAPQALGYLMRMVGNRAWAEDLLQEAFLRVSKHLHEVADDRALRVYLFRAASHVAIDGMRSKRRGLKALEAAAAAATLEGTDPAGSRTAEAVDVAAAVRRSLDRLPPRERSAVLLRIVAGLSLDDVGAALSVSDRGAARLVREGLARIRRRLSGSDTFSDLFRSGTVREGTR